MRLSVDRAGYAALHIPVPLQMLLANSDWRLMPLIWRRPKPGAWREVSRSATLLS